MAVKIRNALIIGDVHCNFHDRKAFNLMLDVAEDSNIHEIVFLGDFFDFYALSSHPKSPSIVTTIREEVEEGQELLAEVRRRFPKIDIFFLEGNHSHRLNRTISNLAPGLFGLIGLDGLIRPDLFKIKIIPYGRNQKYNVLGTKLIARHEPLAGGEVPARGSLKKAMSSFIHGHDHKLALTTMTGIDGQIHFGIGAGWLGNASHPVFNYLRNHDQWNLGFVIITALPNGNFFPQLIPILDYKCIANGHLYSAD